MNRQRRVSGAEGDILDLGMGFGESPIRKDEMDFTILNSTRRDIKHNSTGYGVEQRKPALHVYLRKQFELMKSDAGDHAEQNV